MTERVTFLHTADIHLGAPARGFRDLSPQWADRIVHSIPEAYDRVIDTALARSVDFVIIAGDAFDTSGPSYADFTHFFEGLQRLDDAGIPTYLICGNHDPFSTWERDVALLPPTCRMLGASGPEFALFERDGKPICLIGARGYRNQAWPVGVSIAQGIGRAQAIAVLGAEHPQAAQAPFCVGIIHTGLDFDQSKASCDPRELLDADVDYWACGHLHKRMALPSERQPRIVFPGCVQGRDLREEGERGCYVTTLSRSGSGKVVADLEFVPTASVAFHTVGVELDACQTLADIARLVQAELFREIGKAGCDRMVARIVLRGNTVLHGYLRQPEVLRDLRKRINSGYPGFYCDALVDLTAFARDREALGNEELFESHVLSVSDEQAAAGGATVNYVQAEFVKRGVDVPSGLVRHLPEFNAAAEALVLDLLGDERQ